MQDNLFDEDFGRLPGAPRPNYDEAQAEHKRDFDSTPSEKHEEDERRARAYAENPTARELFSDQRSAVLVENPEDIKRIEQAAAEDAAKAAKESADKATQLATDVATEQMSGAGAGTAAGDAGGKSPTPTSGTANGEKEDEAKKPTSLESTLATIRLSQERQLRLVISGDKSIERQFYEKLATQGKLYYQGGVPIITASRAKALKLLAETVKEVEGATSQHALFLKLDREGGGILQNVKAGIANNLPGFLGRRHEIDVVVVGKQEVVDAKLKELGAFVKDMESNKHVAAGVATVQDDGKLLVKNGKPLQLEGTASLYNVLSSVKNKVDAYNEQESAKHKEVREFRDKEKYDEVVAAKAKAAAAAGAAGKDGPEPIHERTAKIVAHMDRAFQSRDMLYDKTDGNQVEAMASLHLAKRFKDPAERELQTLPDADRQKAIVQLAALVQKAANKEFGDHAAFEVDERKKEDRSTLRERIDSFVVMEAKRDPEFGAKAEPILKDMVERSLLTQQQADDISGRIAEVATAAKEASKAEEAAKAPATEASPPKETDNTASAQATAAEAAPAKDADAPQAKEADATATTAGATSETAAAKEGGKDASAPTEADASKQEAQPAAASAADSGKAEASAQGSEKPADASSVAADARAAAESRSAAEPAADAKAQTADTASDLAAKSGAQTEAATAATPGTAGEPKAASTQASENAASTPTSAAAEAAAPVTTPAAEKPLELRDRIEALAKDGLSNLTEKKADVLVSDLEGIRSKPLSALDANSGEKPTQTLVRAEALLKEVESGRFGPELQVRAKDVSDALQKWGQQDAARYEKDGGLASVQRDTVVAQLKSAEPDLHAGAQATRADAARTTTGPQQGAADTAQRAATPDAAQTQSQPTAEQVAREAAQQRQWETESAGAKLAGMMANPAGSFTNRDKSWNEENIQRAAREVLRIDPESVSQLSAAQRTKIAAYSAWVADNARNGKLPGFSSEDGKAMANQLVERASALIAKMDAGSKIPADVQKTLVKADNMVNTKEELQKTASLTSEAVRDGSSRGAISPAAAKALSTDMVHSVYRQPEVREAQVKYLLKNAANLTPDAIKSLEPQERAKTAVAMSHLAQQVRDGAMGEFSKLPSSVQKSVLSAGQAADNLLNSMSKDPAMRAELNQAYNELHGKSSGAARGTDATTAKAATQEQPTGSKSVDPAASKQDGRSLDR